MIPLTVICGYLGSGKTTLINNILQSTKKPIGVLVNDFGELNIDEQLILEVSKNHRFIFTIEENTVAGGAGSAVNEVLAQNNVLVHVANYGLPDRLLQHGSRDDMLSDAGLTETAFASFIQERIAAD